MWQFPVMTRFVKPEAKRVARVTVPVYPSCVQEPTATSRSQIMFEEDEALSSTGSPAPGATAPSQLWPLDARALPPPPIQVIARAGMGDSAAITQSVASEPLSALNDSMAWLLILTWGSCNPRVATPTGLSA